jgi:hypothetical protein
LGSSHQLTLWARTVEVVGRRATVEGEVWLGPVAVGDCFTRAITATSSDAVRLRLTEISTPAGAQEVGRVPRVIAVLVGDRLERVRPGVVLRGAVEREWVLR